jgi:hypothetical protein
VLPFSFDDLAEEDDDSPNDVVNFAQRMGKMTTPTQWRVQYQLYWVILKHMWKLSEINAFLSDHGGCEVPWNCCMF